MAQFIRESTAPTCMSDDELFSALDEERIVVAGRMRWIEDERVIRDDWAIEFRAGLLPRSSSRPRRRSRLSADQPRAATLLRGMSSLASERISRS
jgi:hypothetical protein